MQPCLHYSMRTFCRESERLKFRLHLFYCSKILREALGQFPTFIIQSNDSTSIRERAEKCDVSMTSSCLATGEKTGKRCFFEKFGVNIFLLNFAL